MPTQPHAAISAIEWDVAANSRHVYWVAEDNVLYQRVFENKAWGETRPIFMNHTAKERLGVLISDLGEETNQTAGQFQVHSVTCRWSIR